MAPWLTNSSGKKDAILTFLFFAIVVILVRFAFGGVAFPLPWTEAVLAVPPFDSAAATALLATLLPTYLARRNGWGNPVAASADPANAVIE